MFSVIMLASAALITIAPLIIVFGLLASGLMTFPMLLLIIAEPREVFHFVTWGLLSDSQATTIAIAIIDGVAFIVPIALTALMYGLPVLFVLFVVLAVFGSENGATSPPSLSSRRTTATG